MKVEYGKDSVMFQKFQDYWAFMKEYGRAEDTEAYWEAFMTAGNQLIQKYSRNEERDAFMYDLVMAFVNEKDRESKHVAIS